MFFKRAIFIKISSIALDFSFDVAFKIIKGIFFNRVASSKWPHENIKSLSLQSHSLKNRHSSKVNSKHLFVVCGCCKKRKQIKNSWSNLLFVFEGLWQNVKDKKGNN